MQKAKVAVLGGSRGLGAAILQKLESHPTLMVSRKPSLTDSSHQWFSFDFSQKEKWLDLIRHLEEFAPEIIFYCAGGGPYGKYGDKSWKDHEWAMKVTFECPSYLLWTWCHEPTLKSVRKFIVIGSAVAEAKPDPLAAMYCASKHALKGLIETIKKESPEKDLHLLSAPYMDTAMLPPGSWPRQQDGLVRPPEEVAETLLKEHRLFP